MSKILIFITKTVLLVSGAIIALFLCFMLFSFATDWIWPEFNGSYHLGKNIYMMEWDGGGKVIVIGNNIKGRTCYGGESLIPTYENQYDSLGNLAEYVIDAKYDDKWIIARTNNKISNQRKFYIIDKRYIDDSISAEVILSCQTEMYTDSTEFSKRCQNYGIMLKW